MHGRPDAGVGSDVFISYSRADRGLVTRLHAALLERDHTAWVDWQDIPPTAEWMREIREAIDASDIFVTVLSPDFIRSRVCGEELEHAVEANKRIVPVVARDVEPGGVPDELAKRNWIFIRASDDVEAGIDTLVQALDTDLERVKDHTRLLVRAREWAQSGDASSRLLRGGDLAEAERWLGEPDRGVEPTSEQRRFLVASRRAASRRQRALIVGVSIALVAAVFLSFFALVQRSHAVEQRRAAIRERDVATSRELASAASTQLAADPELALLLGLEAARSAPTAEAADSLRGALVASHRLQSLNGHENPVIEASSSPDGRYALTASGYRRGFVPGTDRGDYTARIWDVASGVATATIEAQEPVGMHAEFAPDGGSVLTSRDGSPRLWRVPDGSLIRLFEGLHGESRFDHSGSRVVGRCDDGSVCIVDAGTGSIITTMAQSRRGIDHLIFSVDDRLVIGWGEEGAVLWDAREGAVHLRIPAPFPSRWASQSADGSRLMLSDRAAFGVWTMSGGKLLETQAVDPSASAYRFEFEPAINDSGSRVATMNDVGSVTIWNVERPEGQVLVPAINVGDVEFSPDGSRLLTVSEDHTGRLWDPENGDLIGSLLGADGRLWLGSFSPDGTRIVTTGSDLRTDVWATDPGAPLATLTAKPGGDGQSAFFARDDLLLTAGLRASVKAWDLNSNDVAARFTGPALAHDWVWNAAMSPDGSQIAASGSDYAIQTWSSSGELGPELRFEPGEGPGSEGASASLAGAVLALAYSPDGSLLASASQDGIARLWDPSDGSLVTRLVGHEAGVNDVAFDPTGTRVLTGSDDGTARIWRTTDARMMGILHGHPDGVTAVAWSANGTWIATGGYDGTVRIWEAASGRSLHVLTGSQGTVQAADFSPDSRWLATTSDEDGALRLWETATGRLVDVHRGDLGSMGYSVDFSPDGSTIAVPGFTGPFGSGTGEVLLYRCEVCADLDSLIELAMQRATRPLTPEERRQFLHHG